MEKRFVSAGALVLSFLLHSGAAGRDYPIKPVPFTDVRDIAPWQVRMVDNRIAQPRLADAQTATLAKVQLSCWYSAGPIKGAKFTDKSFAENIVDLEAKDDSGNALWKLREDITDGELYEGRLDTGQIEPMYFFRQIRAAEPVMLRASFGSRNALDVWLNGRKIISRTRERGLKKDQHIIGLDLKAGTNELLVRILNWKTRYGFYFSPAVDSALWSWRQVAQEFPAESGWMAGDIGQDGCKAWFGRRDDAELEEKLVAKVLAEIEPAGRSLPKELRALGDSGAGAGDRRWLDLYVKASQMRDGIARLKTAAARLQMLRRAADSLVRSDAKFETWAGEYQERLGGLEQKLKRLEVTLEAGDENKVSSVVSEILNLQRELVAKKPGPITRGPFVLAPGQFKGYVAGFAAADAESIVNFIPNALAADWMKVNIPLFECPDKWFEKIYYYRWWTYRKHIKQTEDGFVLTEFLDQVGHSGKYNTISCAVGHHIYEGRWLHDPRYLDDYIMFWYRGKDGGPQPHFHRYSNWATDAVYKRYLVNKNERFVVELVDDFAADFERWQKERGNTVGLFWQYDVLDGGEESISGSRHEKNIRHQLNCYMYAGAEATAKAAAMAGNNSLAREYQNKAVRIKSLMQNLLWDGDAKFFKVRLEDGYLCGAREAIGFVPWCFNLPDAGFEEAWLEIKETEGFKAPMGLTTAERRHPAFRSHGVGTCEWDGAVWPFATTQTLVALANVLRDYQQDYVGKEDYFEELMKYARSHNRDGKCYIGEYLDEVTGAWLTEDSDRSRFYNHSAFCDLVISGLAGLIPRQDNIVQVAPLLPDDAWDWFCLDNVLYHGRIITILWDRTGEKYGKGKGLHVFADGKEIAHSQRLERVTAKLD